MDFMGVLSPPAAATTAGTGHGGTRAASTARDVHMKPPDRSQAEETMFLAAKTTPDAGCRPVRQKQLLQLQSAAAPAYPNKRQRTFWHQAHEKDPDGLFIHKNKTSACTQHMSPENGQAIIKETNQCSPQIQIVPRDVSLLVRNASLVSFMERRKQRLASAAVAYPRREKSPDEKDTFPLASPRNKTPLGDMEQQWAFTNAKNISGNHDDEALDTELKI
ncbi:hypothetical protein E2562_010415 [Oryza meyeriana var. granulata]|uniref:Uncharacterized protein n=1 Tax=Oryza meyeriana var. granulata TaxID=110450 RepID=A0A6G1F6I7_9ORYZ|nr:hypothetical protein E2562_010415 [Oryza meyeriana var. granulata]